MELDKRFKVLPFCCFNAERCEKYINNLKGYFANRISCFSDINSCKYGTLESVLDDQQESFYMSETEESFSFFIPEYFVKPKEKKYRPYTIEEFCNEGFELVVFRSKNDESIEYHVRYNGYVKYDNDVYLIIFGRKTYPLNELFEDYEYLDDDGKWKPFGVEEWL